jgi:ferrous iron transport protein A
MHNRGNLGNFSEASGPWQGWAEEKDQSKPAGVEGAGKNDCLPREASTVPLAQIQVGDHVQIVALDCGEANSRLMGMGLIPGAVVQVMSSIATGSMIVGLHDHRLGLGAEMAQQIRVKPIESRLLAQNQAMSTTNITSMKPTVEKSAVKLREAAIGSRMKVIGYEPTARDYKRKLLAMGLTPGTEFVLKRHAPLGDPTEIEVRGFRLSLRKAEADALIVKPISGDEA